MPRHGTSLLLTNRAGFPLTSPVRNNIDSVNRTVTASKAMPGLPTGTTDLLQNPQTRSGAPMSRMTGAIPPLPVYRRGADMENITIAFTREGGVKG